MRRILRRLAFVPLVLFWALACNDQPFQPKSDSELDVGADPNHQISPAISGDRIMSGHELLAPLRERVPLERP